MTTTIDVDTTTERLRSHLDRGGKFRFIQSFGADGNGTSIWAPVDKLFMPPFKLDGNRQVYWGVNPTCCTVTDDDRKKEWAKGKTDKEIEPFIASKNGTVAAVNALYAEFDGKDFAQNEAEFLTNIPYYKALALKHIQARPVPPSVIVDSGGGYQCYWLLDDTYVIDSDEKRDFIKWLQSDWVLFVGADPGAKDIRRILRVPGFFNIKPAYGPAFPVVSYITANLDLTYSIADFETLLPPRVLTPPRQKKTGTLTAQRNGNSRHGELPIDAFNATYRIADVLQGFGYTWVGDRMAKPGGKNGTVVIYEDDNESFHHGGEDPLHTGHRVKPFAAFLHYDHDGNMKQAVRAAAELLGMGNNNMYDGIVAGFDQGSPQPIGDWLHDQGSNHSIDPDTGEIAGGDMEITTEDIAMINDVKRFGGPTFKIGEPVKCWMPDGETVTLCSAGTIQSIKCADSGWEYTTTIGKTFPQSQLCTESGESRSPVFSMELPPKFQKAEPIPLPDVSAAPELPDWAKLTPQEMAEAATTGKFLRDYIEFAKDASPMTPVEFNISAGLAAVAIAIARRVHVRVGASKIYPNLYQIYVGPSTLQRKTTGMNTLTRLMELAGMIPIFTLAETQTPEAFVEDMTLNIPSTYSRMSPTARQVWLDRRRLYSQRGWIMDEASRLLDSFNRDYTAGLLPIVLDLYDSKDRSGERNTKSWGNESVEKSYLNIFGATTFSSIGKHVADPERWGDGFFARFSFTASNEPGAWQFWPEPMDYPKRLVDELHRIAFKVFGAPPLTATVTNAKEPAKDEGDDNEKKPVSVISIEVDPLNDNSARFGPGAWQIWERYSKAVGFDMLQQAMTDNSIPVEMFPSYGRLGTMMIKVAMLFAVMDTQTAPVTIERKHVAAAMRIVEMWRNSLHIVKAGGQVTAAKTFVDKVLATLSKNGTNWTIRRDLQHALGCSWAELEPAINDLHGNGLIERVPSPQKRGPKSEMYRVVVLS